VGGWFHDFILSSIQYIRGFSDRNRVYEADFGRSFFDNAGPARFSGA
jgi:hypothetical protein